MEEFKNENEDFKTVADEFESALNSVGEAETNSAGPASKVSPWDGKDFISLDSLRFLLRYKNKFIVSLLAKEMGKETTLMLKDLYVVTDQELHIYRRVVQDFIRENFPEYIEKINKMSGGDIVALLILEVTRFHEAKILLKVELGTTPAKIKEMVSP